MELSHTYIQAVENSLHAYFDKILGEAVGDYENFVVVDGEEGDYGVIRYMLEGECICVEFNMAGDDIEKVITAHGFEKYIKPVFNLPLEVNMIHDASPNNCLAHFMNRDYLKMKSRMGDEQFIANSKYLNSNEKDQLLQMLANAKEQGDKALP